MVQPNSMNKTVGQFLLYFILIIGAVISAFPFYWMSISSLKPNDQILDGRVIPQEIVSDNYRILFSNDPVGLFKRIMLERAGQITDEDDSAESDEREPLILTTGEIKIHSVELQWEPLDGAKSYTIYKSESEGDIVEDEIEYTEIATVSGEESSIIIKGLDEDSVNYFWIEAIMPDGSKQIPNTWSTEVGTLKSADWNFVRAFRNSLFAALVTVFIGLFFDSLGGFAFAKYNFPGREIMFWILLGTMMIPTQVSLVPTFQIFQFFGFTGKIISVIIPMLVTVFGMFLCRQYMMSIPDDLLMAARIDGAREFQIYWNIVLPSSKPILGALAIIRFLASWNNFFWPLIMLGGNPKAWTLPLALSKIEFSHGIPLRGIEMAGSFLASVPIFIVFFMMQRQFIEGIIMGSVKE